MITTEHADRSSLYHILWRLNERCNFDCEYCFRSGIDMNRMKENPNVGIFNPEYIAGVFLNQNRDVSKLVSKSILTPIELISEFTVKNFRLTAKIIVSDKTS